MSKEKRIQKVHPFKRRAIKKGDPASHTSSCEEQLRLASIYYVPGSVLSVLCELTYIDLLHNHIQQQTEETTVELLLLYKGGKIKDPKRF